MRNWIRRPPNFVKLLIFFALLTWSADADAAEEPVLNIYSARHYQSDEVIYDAFTKETGIAVNRIEDREDPLIERITSNCHGLVTCDCHKSNAPAAIKLIAINSLLP